MTAAMLALSLLAAAPAAKAAPKTAEAKGADAVRLELVAGRLPDDPARAIVQSKCVICHSAEYVTQQRLTPAQWKSTVEKMRKFGSPLTDDEVKQVSDYLGKHWTPDLPEGRTPRAVAPPKGALPSR